MRVDALALRLRPRSPFEAADLGVHLCRQHAPAIYRALLLAMVPVVALAAASAIIDLWVPSLVIWFAKPWLDRTILFVLSRAAFDQPTGRADVWRARRQVWWRQLPQTLTIRRLSPWRALTQPVYQLEGGTHSAARTRVRQIRKRTAGVALLSTLAFLLIEICLVLAVFSLVFWFVPEGEWVLLPDFGGDEVPAPVVVAFTVVYGAVVMFLEPFYVAAGFAMYVNRRTDLEAWDLEQEFRRAFA